MKSGFDWAGAVPVIRRLAAADDITIVVGAGTSVESGLPTWPALLERLLCRVADGIGLSATDASSFAEWTVRADGLTGAGAVAKVLLGGDFPAALRTALYEGGGDDLAAGEMARAVARLRLAFEGTPSELVTTNYDPLAMLAVREALSASGRPVRTRPKVRVVASDSPQRDGEIVVRHAHGYLPPEGSPKGTVVLSEADYHLMQDPRSWQEDYFRQRLTDSTCLFVGSSLTDPNLLRYLWRTGGAPRHVAVFARQQHAERYERLPRAVAAARETAAARRWDAMGVVPLLVDHYAQIAQVVSEITAARLVGDAYVPFPDRMSAWAAALTRDALTTNHDLFAVRQGLFRRLLIEVLDGLDSLIRGSGLRRRRGERLHAGLWVYRPDADALVGWAWSDREWRDPRTLEPVSVEWSSEFVAVRAFCQGSVVEQSTADQAATRWNHVVAAPITIETPTLGRLPVGVLTLATTERRATSILHRSMRQLRGAFLPEYLPLLAEMLTP